MNLSWLVIAISSFGAAAPLNIDAGLGKVAIKCKTNADSKPHVWIFKQWHLAPNVDTTKPTTAPLPQEANQRAIYQQLEKWIAEGKLQTVFAEGCSGEIDSTFARIYNGWDYKKLKSRAEFKNYEEVLTLIPLKLEAKFRDRLATICADDDALIKKEGLAFSDARGTLGYYTRIQQLKDQPARVKPYLDDAIQILKLKPGAPVEEILPKLKQEITRLLAEIRKTNHERNLKFVDKIRESKSKDSAFVVGGSHVADLVKEFEKAGLGCTVVDPVGYDATANDSVLEKLEHQLK